VNRSAIKLAMCCVLLSACAPSMSYTRTGPTQPPRTVGCAFDVFTASPTGNYFEIGTVDVMASGYSVPATQLAVFKDKLSPYVCHMGGDAAVASANGLGYYMKATVLKRSPTTSRPAAGPAVPGCQFDTQCKGDRICVKGECISP